MDPWKSSAYSRPDRVPTDKPQAAVGPTARTEAALRQALKNAIGGEEAYFTNPSGETVMINQALADHMMENPKMRWDGREAYFPFIPELITDPYEIWVNFARNEESGLYAVREKYVKSVQLDKKTTLGLVAETTNGLWTGMTYYRGSDSALSNLRQGRLLWGR